MSARQPPGGVIPESGASHADDARTAIPQFRRGRPRVGPALLGRGPDHVPGDRGIDAVAEALLEGRFHPAVFAGVERQDRDPAPRLQASREVAEQRREAPNSSFTAIRIAWKTRRTASSASASAGPAA